MAGPDLAVVMSAVDLGSVVVAMTATFAAIVVVVVAWKGARLVLRSISHGESLPALPIASDGWRSFVNGERVSREELNEISQRHPELREQVRRYSRDAIRKGWF